MRTCSFCNKEIEEGTGKMYVKKDGSIISFVAVNVKKTWLNLVEFQEKLNGLKNDSKKFCNDETGRSSKTSYG